MNADQAFLHRVRQRPASPVPVDSNELARALGAQVVQLDRFAGSIALCFHPSPLFNQGGGVVQGGIVCTMLDFAMAFAGLAMLDPGSSLATINLSTAFLRPVLANKVIVEAMIDRRGGSLLFASARLLTAGKLAATATSTLCVVLA